MITRALERWLGREHAIVAGAVAALLVLSLIYLAWLTPELARMSEAAPGTTMNGMLRPWSVAEFSIAFAMWSAMMVGMMTPSIAPAILTYARFSRHPVTRNAPLAPLGWFVGGYLLAWVGYAFIASVMQAVFLEAGLITPLLRSSSDLFGGSVFILAGGYQLTMMKDTCLSSCRTPLSFINGQGGFRPSAAAALQLGLKHGLYCVGCCWALMAVLFVVGVMELLWIAVISIWVLLEKVFPARGVMTQLSGLVLIGTGIILLARTAI